MRPFARQSARLANSGRARQSSLPRTAERHFHRTTPVASENRPPNNGPPDNHTSFNERREEQKKNDNSPAKSEQEGEKENGDGRFDQRRPGTKRHLRNNKRANDTPKPPPIPDWFLRHNVKLLKDSPGMIVSGDKGQVIRCVDAETGHTLFDVPFYEAWPSQPDAASKSKKGSLQKDFFDQRVKFEENAEKKETAELFTLDAQDSAEEWKNNQLRWAFLEAETSARAAFSLPPENQRSYSLVANRVDLSLQCPDLNSGDHLDEFVRDLARVVQADIVRLDANDFAELADEYVDNGHDGPGTYSNLGYDVFQDYSSSSVTAPPMSSASPFFEPHDEQEMDEDEEDEEDHESGHGGRQGIPFTVANLRDALFKGGGLVGMGGRVVGIGIGVPRTQSGSPFVPSQSRTPGRTFEDSNRDSHPRLVALLESLIDAPKNKTSSASQTDQPRRSERRKNGSHKASEDDPGRDYQRILRHWRANSALWLPQVAKSLVAYLSEASQKASESAKAGFKLTSLASHKDSHTPESSSRRTIIHVRELRDLMHSRLGDTVVQQLSKVVQKRRRAGEQVMIVGTTAQDTFGPFDVPGDSSNMHDFPLRSMMVPPLFNLSMAEVQQLEAGSPSLPSGKLDKPENRRIVEINIRHLQSMMRKLRPNDDVYIADSQWQLNLPGMHFLAERVLSLEQVQRLALIAIGLSQTHAHSERVQPVHLALAGFVATRSDNALKAWSAFSEKKQSNRIKVNFDKSASAESSEKESGEARIDRIKRDCNSHETRLLSGVVDPMNIKTTFSEVHAQVETINALKDLTTLSLLRPEAFKYGVLANDRLPGLLLYGPPGTGKTLLAKAVAKESKATVLEVSGAQIYEKYVGEGEKMVRAVFSLAKKLSPCVVFIDEADAIFGSRSNSGGNRNTHREIINQFLREWDGMDDHSVFMMVASNRPFDLDDAVLRRLPRRLLVDLPVTQDRESILGIHLKNEALDSSVDLAKLAEQTPLYSGSDLKNLSVAAALACVREENELLSQHNKDSAASDSKAAEEFKLPEKRTLLPRHFDKALAEISASISEDMSSLAAIRKFDEQYGDRKGRRKKQGYGFGIGAEGVVDESAVRVRSGSGPNP